MTADDLVHEFYLLFDWDTKTQRITMKHESIVTQARKDLNINVSEADERSWQYYLGWITYLTYQKPIRPFGNTHDPDWSMGFQDAADYYEEL
jgi:hypothetical protein